MTSVVLVDAHVHVHAHTDVDAMLDAAVANFAGVARRLQATAWQGVLMLCEVAGVDWFESALRDGGARAWRLQANAGEAGSLRASAGSRMLHIIAGRQVVTSEGIEVLALATPGHIPDGMDLPTTLAAAHAAGALVVLPWGAGKWLGRRGTLVAAALDEAPQWPLYAGDNSGRPFFWPAPAIFRRLRKRGRPLLSGSDPLPLPRQEQRVGGSGFSLPGPLRDDAPARALKERLAAAAEVRGFGRRDGAWSFFHNQLMLRLRKPSRVAASQSSVPTPGAETPDVETSSAAYASRFAGPAGRYLLAVQSRAISRSIAGVAAARALDVGGGHGQLVALLQQQGWRVTVHGTDPQCERNLRELHGCRDCDYVNGSLFALPAGDRAYELVIAVRLISHVENWRALVAEMCRVAGQSVVIDYPSKTGLNALTPLLFGLKKSLEGNTRTYASFSEPELRAEFARHGFRFGRRVKQFFLPMVIHRMGKGAAPFRWIEALCRALGLTALAGSPVILRMDRR